MNTFDDLINSRQSTRKFIDKQVSREEILKCIEAARLAPSATNSQPWKYIVVDDPAIKTELAKTTYNSITKFNKFLESAPTIVVITLEYEQLTTRIVRALRKKEWRLIDIGITAIQFCLKAEEIGLGTCMVGWFDEKKIMDLLNIPSNKSVALLIGVGYAPDDYKLRKKTRKPLEDISSFNKY